MPSSVLPSSSARVFRPLAFPECWPVPCSAAEFVNSWLAIEHSYQLVFAAAVALTNGASWRVYRVMFSEAYRA